MILSAGLLPGCNRAPAATTNAPPTVTVSLPLQQEVIEWDEYIGRLEASERVDVRARVSGLIESVHFEDGQRVEKDQLLFKIDPRPFQAEYDRAKGDVTRAEAQLKFATVELAGAEKSRETGAVSTLEYETKQQAKQQAVGSLTSAKAAETATKLNLDFTEVRAPIAGQISNRKVTPGNLVNGGDGQATLLTTITKADPIYCYVNADEASILKYQRLAAEKKRVSARDEKIPCSMRLSNEPDFMHEGIVDFVDNHLDPTTGTLLARGTFANPNRMFSPGLFARLRVAGSGRYQALLIPDAAIGTDQGQKFVYVVAGPDNTVEYRKVKLGALFGTLRAIEEGVAATDRVIINGTQKARVGGKVDVKLSQISSEAYKLTTPGSPATQALPTTRYVPTTGPSTQQQQQQSSQ